MRLVGQLAESIGWWPFALLGLVVGVVGGVLLMAGEPVITVSDRAIVIVKGEQRRRFARAQIGLAAVEGKSLLLRDADDVELAYHKLDARRAEQAAAALHRHGWAS